MREIMLFPQFGPLFFILLFSIICTVPQAALCKALKNLKFVDANRKSNSVCVFFRV